MPGGGGGGSGGGSSRLIVAENSFRGGGSSSSQLGPRSTGGHNASLGESLLGGGGGDGILSSYAATSGLYNPDDYDIRTEEEEAATARVLGYDPFEAAREEDREREEAVREAAEELKRHHGRVTLAVPSIGDPALHVGYEADMSRRETDGATVAVIHLPLASSDERDEEDLENSLRSPTTGEAAAGAGAGGAANDMASIGASLSSAGGSFMVLSSLGREPWAAMPRWMLPHRILLAKAVAITLGLCAVAVIILNIEECASGNGC